MNLLARLRSWFRSARRGDALEREMHDELQFHIDEHVQCLMEQGAARDDAYRQAHRAFGAPAAHQEEMRDALGLRWLNDLRSDLRYAIRMLGHSRAFTAVTVLSLALGIGANTAIFSLLESVLWRTVPASDPSSLRLFTNVSGLQRVYNSHWGMAQRENGVYTSTSFSYPVYRAFTEADSAFETIFAFKALGRVHAVIGGAAQSTTAHLITGNYYRGAGVTVAFGRPIGPSDDRPGAAPVAVISDTMWRTRFGASPSVLGRSIVVNDVPVVIVGVNRPEFTSLEPGANPDVFLPVALHPTLFRRAGDRTQLLDDGDEWWLVVMGRLKMAANETQARQQLQAVLTNTVRATLPGREKRDQPHLRLLDGSRGSDLLRFHYSGRLTILALLVSLILALACANAASLLMARASARHREIGLRLALGAGWGRLTRQLLSEGMVLALLAGAAGALLGYSVRNAIPRLMGASWQPPEIEAGFGPRVLLASLAVTLATGILFSLAPAWQSRRVPAARALESARATAGPGRLRIGRLLVVLQVFLALVIVSGAGLALRTLTNLRSVPLGFEPRNVLLFEVTTTTSRYPVDQIRTFVQRIREEMKSLPGVQSATFSSVALIADNEYSTSIEPAGRPCAGCEALMNSVGPRFFETMRIPVIAGRALNETDREDAPAAAVVNQAFARRFFPGENALGKTFNRTIQVVGIAADARYSTLHDAPPPTAYLAAAQQNPAMLYGAIYEVKTAVPVAAMTNAIRDRLRQIDAEALLINVRTQTEQINATVANESLFAAITSAFGFLGSMLACVGLYGLMSHSVARRTGEIGIRTALGARADQILAMVFREAFALVGAGIVLGAIGSAVAARAVGKLLFGVEPYGFLSLIASALALAAAAALATYYPARRAAKADPMAALRHD